MRVNKGRRKKLGGKAKEAAIRIWWKGRKEVHHKRKHKNLKRII